MMLPSTNFTFSDFGGAHLVDCLYPSVLTKSTRNHPLKEIVVISDETRKKISTDI